MGKLGESLKPKQELINIGTEKKPYYVFLENIMKGIITKTFIEIGVATLFFIILKLYFKMLIKVYCIVLLVLVLIYFTILMFYFLHNKGKQIVEYFIYFLNYVLLSIIHLITFIPFSNPSSIMKIKYIVLTYLFFVALTIPIYRIIISFGNIKDTQLKLNGSIQDIKLRDKKKRDNKTVLYALTLAFMRPFPYLVYVFIIGIPVYRFYLSLEYLFVVLRLRKDNNNSLS